ncbi:Ferric reductase transmembrane component-like protein [Hapsidospora chrysogenum ATCC 11550]|uniref:Ferric reductase transmembrane component-like protein n=1 Tax=Hapsidospora chrysogenum (strain ATCC 11550 / CBS 779.69 / DSM 880 / IAM 14645 / JCM 23072 / IMI 49137) TaxID=857340 RepID=A0A086TG19_HAPC1|nr:Ferric reductase transmembrane component-like protein [Hapsidospora chrysogenum ATCC 11550]
MFQPFLSLLTVAGLCSASIGLTGIDSFDNQPFCATACYGSLSSYRLDCSVVHGDEGDVRHAHVMTSPECRADNLPFLTSLAWCIRSKCDEVGEHLTTSAIEQFWERTVTGDPAVQPIWSYRQALANVSDAPTMELTHGGTINETVVTPEFWNVLYGTYTTLYQEGWNMNVFGLIILNVGFGLPILLTWLGKLPFLDGLYDRLRPYIVYPSLIGTYHIRPLPFLLGNAPTMGQALYIALMVVLNVVLSAINFKTTEAHLWFQSKSQQITGYLMYRTGVLSFAMAPLLILFSGRNNLLQWITDWPHSTFVLLHRWIARLFALQALLHTVLAVAVYSEMGIYEAEAVLPYWAWGVVGTLFACIMVVASSLFFRRMSYEVFLFSHIVMAILVIVGSWYHIVERFEILSGFTMWLWTASAVWVFDRLGRVLRILKVGPRRSRVTDIGDGYVRIDIPDVHWGMLSGKKVYVYLPSLNPLRPWENHPFSVIPTSLLSTPHPSAPNVAHSGGSDEEGIKQVDVEKPRLREAPPSPEGNAARASQAVSGLTLLVRKSNGMTKRLRSSSSSSSSDSLLTLLEGPYRDGSLAGIFKCDRVLLIGGGIGITSLLPMARGAHHPNVKLCWSLKQSAECLLDALQGALEGVADKDVKVGSRTDIEGLLRSEAEAGWTRIGVVACGPGGLCDDVRAAVARAGRRTRKTIFELHVDAYSW